MKGEGTGWGDPDDLGESKRGTRIGGKLVRLVGDVIQRQEQAHMDKTLQVCDSLTPPKCGLFLPFNQMVLSRGLVKC